MNMKFVCFYAKTFQFHSFVFRNLMKKYIVVHTNLIIFFRCK